MILENFAFFSDYVVTWSVVIGLEIGIPIYLREWAVFRQALFQQALFRQALPLGIIVP